MLLMKMSTKKFYFFTIIFIFCIDKYTKKVYYSTCKAEIQKLLQKEVR